MSLASIWRRRLVVHQSKPVESIKHIYVRRYVIFKQPIDVDYGSSKLCDRHWDDFLQNIVQTEARGNHPVCKRCREQYIQNHHLMMGEQER